MPPVANWSYPTSVRFGAGRLSELPEACRAAGIRRPLLVTDRGLAGHAMVTEALEHLAAADRPAALFAEVAPNPTDRDLAAGVAAFRAGDHDGVVAMGGGSGLDLGKLVAFMAGQSRPVWAFEDIADWWTRADAAAIAPIVAVPTTAGTGSEVGRAAVLTNAQDHAKKIIFHPRMLPAEVIADPVLTMGMPRAITAGTGMDALAHCLEAYCSPHFHPMSHGIALEGMRLVLENLPRVHAAPDDLEARAQMMAAAAMGAVAFQKGLGAIHAVSHPVGALFDTHHGTTNAVVMPQVLAFNRPAIEARIDRAAAYLEIAGGFEGFVAHVTALRDTLGLPDRLLALGVTAEAVPVMVPLALADPSVGGNPIALTAETTRALFEACL